MNASVSERHERNADRQRRDARGRREAEDVPIPEERPFLDRELRAALRPLLEGQDAEHDEGPVEEQEKQADIDGENGLEERETPSLSKLLLQVDDPQEARDDNAP